MSGATSGPDGLDMTRLDVTTPEEIAQFREHYRCSDKGALSSFGFWISHRPDVLKRHRLRTPFYDVHPDGDAFPLPGFLVALHEYAAQAFSEGVGYKLRVARSAGARLGDVLDVFSIAFMHAGHPAMYAVTPWDDYLDGYAEIAVDRSPFPDNWAFDPDVFTSGMDFDRPEVSQADVAALRAWYMNCIGEVPRNVDFLAENRPGLLKAYRNRYEHAIRDSLPAQMLPYLLLTGSVVRGSVDGIRENALLARALGVTEEQILNAVCTSVLFCGADALGLVAGTVPEIFGL